MPVKPLNTTTSPPPPRSTQAHKHKLIHIWTLAPCSYGHFMPLSFCDCYDSPPHSLVARLRTAPAARLKVTQPRFFVVDSLPVLSRCLFPFNLSIFVFLEMNLKHSKQRYSVKHTFNSPKKKKKKKHPDRSILCITLHFQHHNAVWFIFLSFFRNQKKICVEFHGHEWNCRFSLPLSKKRPHNPQFGAKKKKKKRVFLGFFWDIHLACALRAIQSHISIAAVILAFYRVWKNEMGFWNHITVLNTSPQNESTTKAGGGGGGVPFFFLLISQ